MFNCMNPFLKLFKGMPLNSKTKNFVYQIIDEKKCFI